MHILYKRIIIGLVSLAVIVGLIILIPLLISYQTWADIVSRSVEIAPEELVTAEDSVIDILPEDTVLKNGSFADVDLIHFASGEVVIREEGDQVFIEFQEDFSVADGPDLYIHLSAPQEYGNAKQGSVENTLNLGKIVSKEGVQTYVVTKEEWEQYNHSILIWCRAFGIHFSHAILD